MGIQKQLKFVSCKSIGGNTDGAVRHHGVAMVGACVGDQLIAQYVLAVQGAIHHKNGVADGVGMYKRGILRAVEGFGYSLTEGLQDTHGEGVVPQLRQGFAQGHLEGSNLLLDEGAGADGDGTCQVSLGNSGVCKGIVADLGGLRKVCRLDRGVCECVLADTCDIGTGNISNLMKGLLVPLCVYVIAAISLTLVVGISGELSLGHAGFMCVGAYSSAFFSVLVGNGLPDFLRFLLAIMIGAAVAALFGILIGIPVLKLRGDYLANVTLAFGEIIKNLMNVLYIGRDSKGLHFSVTDTAGLNMGPDGKVIVKGALGITGTPKNSTFTIGVILILIALFIILNLINSRSGRAIMAIRDNRIAAESVGINITKYKLLAFSIIIFETNKG